MTWCQPCSSAAGAVISYIPLFLVNEFRPPKMMTMVKKLTFTLLIPLILSGCGVLAAPCRIASAGIKMVPVVGHVAAVPTDACAAVIDP